MDEQTEREAGHLEGLRAWLAEIDLALRVRTRAGLALLLVAVCAGGVGLYLAIEDSQNSAPLGEVQKLGLQVSALRAQQNHTAGLTARILTARSLENRTSVELAELHAQVESLRRLALARGTHASRTRRSGSYASQAGGKGGSPAKVTRSNTGGADVSTAANPKFGAILVNSQGFTLYDFQKDRGGGSACYGACAKIWPPLITSGTPQGARGAEGQRLGTTPRSDGTTQVTYGGHPLYTYVGDRKPGEAAGNGITEFGGSWHALHPDGREAGG
jgi:predicted lipoprotein with Yx(FWY)xxD motif